MIDRPARDWLADLVERTLAGEFDPTNSPNKPFPENPHAKSKDPAVAFAMGKLDLFFVNKFHDKDGPPVIVNEANEARRMRNLITYLRSDVEHRRRFSDRMMALSLAAVVFGIFAYIFSVGTPQAMGYAMHGCCFLVMVPEVIAILIFNYRHFRPPGANTDEKDPWPFENCMQLIEERARQTRRPTESERR